MTEYRWSLLTVGLVGCVGLLMANSIAAGWFA